MIPVLIVHTNPTISTSIELMLEKYNAGVEKCLGYNRSEPIYYAQHQKPSIVFMESRYTLLPKIRLCILLRGILEDVYLGDWN
jgi:hypothetical protein